MSLWQQRYPQHAVVDYASTLRDVRLDLASSTHILDGSRRYSRLISSIFAQLRHSHFSVNGHSSSLLDDDTSLPQIATTPMDAGLDAESLDVPASLRNVVESLRLKLDESHEPHGHIAAAIDGCRRPAPIAKLELPLLKSHHAHDFRQFLLESTANRLRPSPLCTSILPVEPVDDDADAGMAFPDDAFRERLNDQMEHEALDLSEEHLTLIAETQKLDLGSGLRDVHALVLKDLDELPTRMISLTPPLLPYSDTPSPFLPSGSECELPLVSDPTTLAEEDSEKLLEESFDREDLDADAAIIPLSSPQAPWDLPPDTPRPAYVKLSDVMIEPPLPTGLSPSSTFETSQLDLGVLPLLSETSEWSCGNARFAEQERQLQQTFETAAQLVMQQINQEQPDPVDALTRLPVPVLDFDCPAPGWGDHTRSAKDMFSWIKQTFRQSFQYKTYPRNHQREKELRWVPFPAKAAKVQTEELIGDLDEALTQLETANPTPPPTSADFISWRPKSPRALQIDDTDNMFLDIDEDRTTDTEHQPASSPVPPDISKRPIKEDELMLMVRKRKAESILGSTARLGQKRPPTTALLPSNGLFTVKNDPLATDKLLSAYINMRAPKKARLATSRFFPATAHPQSPTQPKTPQPQALEATPPRRWPAPTPTFVPPTKPVRLLVATTIPLTLLSRMRRQFSASVELIDRDFSLHNTWSAASSAGLGKGQEIVSPLAFEADLAVSASTGMMVTTLIKVRQKPLPGSGVSMSKLRERITKVAPLYERLIVLVSEDSLDETTTDMMEADTRAVSELRQYCRSLQGADVQVMYAAGGPQSLSEHVASVVCQYIASAKTQAALSLEETDREIFLRKAGLNAYAAQVLVHRLQELHGQVDLPRLFRGSVNALKIAAQGLFEGNQLVDGVCKRLHRRVG